MKQVMLIDDDRDDAELFKEALSEINSSIVLVYHQDSRAALKQLLDSRSDLPELIFLDINMPLVSGWQCLTEFKNSEHLKDIAVIMFTTSSQSREKEIAEELGAQGFITKPSDYETLKRLLSSIINN